MRFALLAMLLAPLGACTIAESRPVDEVPNGSCRNDALAEFTGQPASQELGARMLAASGATTVRWVPKGGMVTMDYRADRITVYLDGSNNVERAGCG